MTKDSTINTNAPPPHLSTVINVVCILLVDVAAGVLGIRLPRYIGAAGSGVFEVISLLDPPRHVVVAELLAELRLAGCVLDGQEAVLSVPFVGEDAVGRQVAIGVIDLRALLGGDKKGLRGGDGVGGGGAVEPLDGGLAGGVFAGCGGVLDDAAEVR